jgi:hypothetical protein
MKRGKISIIVAAAAASLLATACGRFGQVGQGKVIAYDRGAGVLTVIEDTNRDQPTNPRYDKLPPVTVRVPDKRSEMGPDPIPGRLLALDTVNNRAMVFDGGSIKAIPYTPIEQRSGVAPSDREAARCPIIDREHKTIRVYAQRQGRLVTFTVADQYLALPEDAWREGEEVRYYYKQPGQALRLMNVTRAEEK